MRSVNRRDSFAGLPRILGLCGLCVLGTATIPSCLAQGIVTLIASPNPATFGQPVTLTANVPGSVGTVTYFDGTTILGDASVNGAGQAIFTTSLIQAGKRSLRAFYSATSQFSAPFVLTVNSKPGGAFQPGVHYNPNSSGSVIVLAVGDFNKDGHPDLAMLNSSALFVLLSNGNGTFQSPSSFDVTTGQPTAPTNILVGDFNNDGNMDIAIGYAPGAGTSLQILLGNGNGTFQSPLVNVPTVTPSLLAIGDVNKDGNADLLVANASTNTVDVLLGSGNATFSPAGALVVQGPAAGVVVDLNNDGNPDLAVTGTTNNDVTVFRGLGNGRFVGQTPVAAGTNPVSIVSGDFNGDGNSDLAVANLGGNSITVFLGNGTTVLPAGSNYAFTAPFVVTTGDINGDGITDLVVTGNPPAGNGTVGILQGNANGTFQGASTFNLRTANTGIVVSEFNGDGRSDLAVGIDDTGIADVFLQLLPTSTTLAVSTSSSTQGKPVTLTATVTPAGVTGTVTFSAASVPIATVPLAGGQAAFTTSALPAGAVKLQATYSGDSLHAASTSSTVVDLVTPFPSQGFGLPTTFPTSAAAGVIALGDFNGDGITDVAAYTNLSLSILLGRGDGTFQSPIVTAIDFGANSMSAGDFNLDGKLDLALSDGSIILILLGRGDGTFMVRSGPFVSGAIGIAVGDFNLDGKPDLIFALGSSIQVSQGNGDGTFRTPEPGPVGSLPYTAVAVADFNNDGLPDFTSTGVSVVNQGDGILLRPVHIFNTGFNPVGLVVGDFNNDGNPDAAVVDSSGIVSVALGNGNGTFAASQNFAAGSSPAGLTAGDFNGDGKLDIAVVNNGSSNISVLLGNGNGTFQAPVNYPIGANARGIAAGDFNGDGRTDVAVTYSSGVAILLGTPPVFTVSPTSLTFSFTPGGPLPPTQTIQVTSGSLSLPFDFGTSVFPPWLNVTASSKTTPASVFVSVNPSGLGPGTYRTSFVVNFPGVGSQVVTVTFGYGSSVTVSTTFLVFSYVLGQPKPAPQSVDASSDGGAFQASGSASFLIINTTATGVSVGIDPTGLGIGDYNASVSISSNGVGSATVQVLLRVRAPLVVSPSDFSVIALNTGPALSQSISVTSGPAQVSYTVATPTASWASVDSSGGTTPGSFNVRIDATGLKPGIYKAIINVSSTQTSPDTAPVIVTLTVPAPGPLLGITPDDLTVAAPGNGGAPVTFTFPLVSSNQVSTPFNITVAGGFLTVFPVSGQTPALITVIVDPSKFAPGSTNKGSFTLTSAVGTLTKNIIINAGPPNPTLSVFPPILEVQTPRGQKASAKLLLQNPGGGGPQNFFVSVADAQNNPFVTVVPASGVLTDSSPVVVQVNIDTTSLPVGPFEVMLRVKFGDPSIQSVPVSVFITPADPAIGLDFQGVKFDARKGEGLTVTQDVSILDLGDLPYTWTAEIVSGDFLSLASGPTSGSSAKGAPGKITLAVKQDFLSSSATVPGTYYASVRIRSPQAVNSPKLFTAVLNVLDPSQVDATPLPNPAGLVFTTPRGVDPAKQTVRLFASSKSPRTFQVSAQTYTGPDKTGNAPGISWLSTSVSSGTATTNTPGVVDVLVRTAGLAPGVYTGGVTFSLSSTAVRVVNVSLVVTPGSTPAKTAIRLADASCAPTKLVPTFVGGLVNNFSQQVAGPVPITVKVTDDCGNLVPDPTNPASVPADVSITFSAGDPSAKRMLLTDPKNANYTITWVPDASAAETEVAVQAQLGDLSGLAQSSDARRLAAAAAVSLIAGTAKDIGQVLAGTGPVLLPNATLNNLNPQPGGPLAPGTLVQIFGANLSTSDTPVTAQSVPLPPTLNGTQVLIGGIPAPLYYVSKTQINAMVPFELTAGTQYDVIVTVNGSLSTPSPISLIPATPGLASDSDGNIIAQHTDGTLVTAASPALPGEVIILYLAGMGLTSPPVASGIASPFNPLALVVSTPVVTIDDKAAPDIMFAGLSPGSVGLYQINLRIPADGTAGAHQLLVTQNGVRSNAATLPIGAK